MLGLPAPLAPYRWLAMGLALMVLTGGAYLRGRGDGHAAEAAQWQKREIDRQAQAQSEREQLQHELDARTALLAQRQQEAADAIQQVRVEYLPAKTIVKREVVERAVYRECVVDDSMRDTLNAALRGTPGASPAAADGPGSVSF